jgi:DNA-binding response OmpR family regulator
LETGAYLPAEKPTNQELFMSRVTLLGLPEDLAQPLAHVLRADAHQVNQKRFVQDLSLGPRCEAVFISGDSPEFGRLIALLREAEPRLPVIVVARVPATKNWLDALDAGATDYCGAPFEPVQVRWIMESVARAESCTAA